MAIANSSFDNAEPEGVGKANYIAKKIRSMHINQPQTVMFMLDGRYTRAALTFLNCMYALSFF
jgi:hypothetical protein